MGMDFLDEKAVRRHELRLFIGYGLIALMIGAISLVLLYQSYGYGVDKTGEVKQSGLVFVTSQPQGANIYLNDTLKNDQTNARLSLDSGNYKMKLSLAGYYDWSHDVSVNGGDLQRFDYPLLIPKKLVTTKIGPLLSEVSISTQSPDRRWVLLGDSTRQGVFVSYDFKNPKKVAVSEFVLPSTLVTLSAEQPTWELTEWSNDNVHVILRHNFVIDGVARHEYILVNRENPENSKNLSKDLNLDQDDAPTLFDKKIARFYVYSPIKKSLRAVSSDGVESTTVSNVLAYKTYGEDVILYVTDTYPGGRISSDSVYVILQQGLERKLIRKIPASMNGQYVLDIAKYDGKWFAALGSQSGNGLYIYKNPFDSAAGQQLPKPWRFMRLTSPNYVAFSQSTRFILTQSGQFVSLIDLETSKVYHYSLPKSLDAPQAHSEWMDGHRIMYVSEKSVQLIDYDNTNYHQLVPASAAFKPYLAPDFRTIYTLLETPSGLNMTATSFLIQ